MKPAQIIDNYPESDYFAHEALSCSEFKKFMQSGEAYQSYLNGEFEFKNYGSLDLGTAIHLALLEPERYPHTVIHTGAVDKRRSEWKQAVANKLPGQILFTQKETKKVERILSQAKRAGFTDLFKTTKNEQTIFWRYEDVPCRSRVDAMSDDGCIYDLKTTSASDVKAFKFDMRRYKYDVQAWFYSNAYFSVHGAWPKKFHFKALQTVAPYGAFTVSITPEAFIETDALCTQKMKEFISQSKENVWLPEVLPDEVVTYDASYAFQQGLPTNLAMMAKVNELKGAFEC